MNINSNLINEPLKFKLAFLLFDPMQFLFILPIVVEKFQSNTYTLFGSPDIYTPRYSSKVRNFNQIGSLSCPKFKTFGRTSRQVDKHKHIVRVLP